MTPAEEASVTLEVELCGRLADGIGPVVPVEMPPTGCSAGAFLDHVRQQHPSLAPHVAAGRVRLCVNETVVGGDAPVLPRDVVALFPPVSGG